MNISNLIIIAAVALIVVSVSVYLIRAKKSGVKCIGCPDGKACSGSCGSGCGSCQLSCGKISEE